ncbi:hypothetical protein SPAN111604_08025 [Sphingomonas antarctica]|uniref:hypothetical protein n=1 Tax=Sphingomonas antarctica TaxID=2040274 RepID=UPI0039EB2EF7
MNLRPILLAMWIAVTCAPALADTGDGARGPDPERDRPGLMRRLREGVEAPFRRRGEQDQAYHARREGTMLPLRDIEGGVVPDMRRRGADYIGAELDGGRYRLKFMRSGSVIWVDVDGRTGDVVGRAGE